MQKDQANRRKNIARLCAPVISIGNLSTGGTGKTPLTIWLCEFLIKAGLDPAVLTRGYKRSGKNPGQVPVIGQPSELSHFFGDEPVMISERLPTTPVWVGKDRAACGKAALSAGAANVLVLDDGFQHLALYRDLDIVLIDCRNPFGNGFTLPAGPLREPLSHLGRADCFLITHAGSQANSAPLRNKLEDLFPGKPVVTCRHQLMGLRLPTGGPLFDFNAVQGLKAVAFAGIADPGGFFKDLKNSGINICDAFGFPDHHRYTAMDFSKIFGAASGHKAELIITTAKDSVRIAAPFRDAFAIAEIGIDFGPEYDSFCRLIAAIFSRPGICSRTIHSSRL